MIAFTTIVLGGSLYERISYTLCDTFLKHTQDCELVILTDNPAAYENYWDQSRIHIINIGPQPKDFDLNLKYLCLEKCWELLQPEYIVLCDADIYLTQDLDNTSLESLPVGVSVPFGSDNYRPSEFPNRTGGEKAIALEPDDSIVYHQFVERCLIFKTGPGFTEFVDEWKKIFEQVARENLNYCGQIFEIQIACKRSGYPLHNMPTPHVLQDVLWTHERDGRTYTALR